jgi:hypothetical protein
MTSGSIKSVKQLRGSAPHVDASAATLSNATRERPGRVCWRSIETAEIQTTLA